MLEEFVVKFKELTGENYRVDVIEDEVRVYNQDNVLFKIKESIINTLSQFQSIDMVVKDFMFLTSVNHKDDLEDLIY